MGYQGGGNEGYDVCMTREGYGFVLFFYMEEKTGKKQRFGRVNTL